MTSDFADRILLAMEVSFSSAVSANATAHGGAGSGNNCGREGTSAHATLNGNSPIVDFFFPRSCSKIAPGKSDQGGGEGGLTSETSVH